jgi:hypothetical protein
MINRLIRHKDVVNPVKKISSAYSDVSYYPYSISINEDNQNSNESEFDKILENALHDLSPDILV